MPKKQKIWVLTWKKRPLEWSRILTYFMISMAIGQLILVAAFVSILPIILYFISIIITSFLSEYKFKITEGK